MAAIRYVFNIVFVYMDIVNYVRMSCNKLNWNLFIYLLVILTGLTNVWLCLPISYSALRESFQRELLTE